MVTSWLPFDEGVSSGYARKFSNLINLKMNFINRLDNFNISTVKNCQFNWQHFNKNVSTKSEIPLPRFIFYQSISPDIFGQIERVIGLIDHHLFRQAVEKYDPSIEKKETSFSLKDHSSIMASIQFKNDLTNKIQRTQNLEEKECKNILTKRIKNSFFECLLMKDCKWSSLSTRKLKKRIQTTSYPCSSIQTNIHENDIRRTFIFTLIRVFKISGNQENIFSHVVQDTAFLFHKV